MPQLFRYFTLSVFFLSVISLTAQGPGGIPDTDLSFWLRSDRGVTTSGGTLTSWLDQSSSNNDATDETAPVFTASSANWNNQPAITFSSASLSIENATNINDGDQLAKTMVIAFRAPSSVVNGNELIYEQGGGTNGLVFYLNGDGVSMTVNMGIYTADGTNYAFESFPVTTSTNYIASFTFDNLGTAGYLNNSTAGSTQLTGGTTPITPLLSHTGDITMGNNTGDNRGAGITVATGSAFTGELTELIQYDRVLNGIELEAVSNYLSSKFDIAITNDRFSGDTPGNGDYDFDVVLLGNDGTNSQVTVNSSFYAITETGFASGEYLVTGEDGNPLALVASPSLSRSHRLQRTWSIEITGATNVIDNLSFPDSGADNYALVLDDNESFSSPLEVAPTSTAGGVISFNNVDLSSFGGLIYLTIAADVKTPGGTSTLTKLWYRADIGVEEANADPAEDSDQVEFWRDQSGTGNNARQSTVAERAVWDNSNTINGNPVLTFDGADDHMAIANLFYDDVTTLDEMTIYAVAKTTKTSEGIIVSYDRSSFYRFSTQGDGDVRLGTNQVSTITDFDSQNAIVNDGNPHLIGADFDGASSGDQRIYFDGSLNSTLNTGTGFLGNASELPRYGFISKNSEAAEFDGEGTGDAFQGDLAEIIYFENILSPTEKNQLETYLAIKYGLTLSSDTDGDATAFEAGEGDYLSSDGVTVVWDADANQGYHNNIAGLTNSQESAFTQTSSRSSNSSAILTVTEASLADEEYMLFGSNLGALGTVTSSSSFDRQLQRVWKAQITGATTSIDEIAIDLNEMSIQPEDASSIALLVDDNESFSSPIEVSGSYVGGVLTLTNVDLSGGNVFFTVALNIETPAGVNSNLAFWFKADTGVEEASGDASEDGDQVRFWRDQSGNGYDGEQTDLGERPVYDQTNTINFNPVLTFDGATHLPIRDLNYDVTTNTLNEFTIYSIVKSNQSDEGIVVSYDRSSFYRFAVNHNGTANFGLSTAVEGSADEIDDNNANNSASDGLTHLIGGDYTTTTDIKNLYFDGAVDATFAGAHGATGGILGESTEVPRFGFIAANSEAATFNGGNAPTGLIGDVAEIIYFEGILSSQERARIETYLAIRYGVTLSSDYVASNGSTVIWDNSGNVGFNNDIVAIGLDQTANLSQMQSKSEAEGSILTISDAALSDGDYVILGSDEGDLSISTSGTGSQDSRFNRIWKYEVTGSTTNVDQLLFDFSAIVIKPSAIANYSLLIDDASDFASVVREVSPTSITNGVLQFDNVDLSGSSFISIAVTPDLDNDGIADASDLDDDNDGLLDSAEGDGLVDTDGDGIFDSRDLDSDNDGIGDLYEASTGTTLSSLDVNGDGILDGAVGSNGLHNSIESDDTGAATVTYTISNSDGRGPSDFRDLDTDDNGISDLVESGRSTNIDSDDDGVFEGIDTDQDGVPDEVDAEDNTFGSTELIPNNQDGTGEPDFRDLDNDDDTVNDIIEVQLTDSDMDGRLDGLTDVDGDGVILERDDDDAVFGQINLADLVTGAGSDWYSYRTGDWDDPDSWTLDPSGSTRVNPSGLIPNNLIDNVTILNGDEITLNFDGLVLSSLSVEEGGIVNIGTTINHNFNTISGTGTISLASNEFPGGTTTAFSAATGGTVIYTDQSPAADYELSVAKTFNNMIINSVANTVTLKADLTLNGSLTVQSGTLQINDNTTDSYADNTTPLNILVNGDMTVQSGGNVTVGNVDASSQIGTSGIFNFHQLELLGDFTNDGSVSFTNLSNTSISDGRYRDKYPTAADADNNTGSNDIPAEEFGAVEVLYTNGLADQLNSLNGPTDFYRIEVKKGTSQTFVAEFNASNTANFRLLGRIAMDQSDDSGDTPNIDNHRALGLEAGILKLGDNIVINQISKEDDNGSDPSTQGGNRNYMIDVDAQLWLASNSVVTKSNDWGIHPFGKLKVSDDATLTFSGTGQRTILIDNQGVFEMTGGTVDITQYRNKTGADGAPRGSFIMTGGTLNIGQGGVDGNHGIFSIPWEEQNFILSAADPANPPVINITLDGNRGKDNAAIQIGVKDGNFSVGESSINITHTSNTDYKMSSTAPLFNLTYNSSGTGQLQISNIIDADDFAPSNGSATLPDNNSGTLPSPATFAQELIILNDLSIEDGRLDANDINVTVGNIFSIDNGAEYDAGLNTTLFNGSSPIQRLVLNGTDPLLGGFNNLSFLGSGTTKEDAGDLATITVRGDLSIGTGVTLNDGGKAIVVNGNILNSGIHETDFSSPGRIEVSGGSATHTIGGDGNGRFEILTINDAVNAVTLTANQQIDSVLNLSNGVLDINTNQLIINSTTTNPILDDAAGTSNFGDTRMIQTAGNASDGGLSYYFNGTSADPGATLFPIGTNANASTRYTPALVDLSGIADDGFVQIRVSDSELQTVDVTEIASNLLTYYWRVSHNGFSTLPTVDSYVFTTVDSDDPDGGATAAGLPAMFVPGKVLDENPFTRSQEDVADIANFDITFNGAGTGFTIENANYTAGDGTTNLFTGSPEVYYNNMNGTRNWNVASSWFTDETRTLAAADFPQSGDIAIISGNNFSDAITVNGTQEAAEVIFERLGTYSGLESLPRLRFNPTDQLTVGKVSGVGDIYLQRNLSNSATLIADIGDFAANDSSLVQVYLTENGSYNINDGDFFNVFPSLRIYGQLSGYNREVSFNYDFSAKRLLVDGQGSLLVGGNYTIEGETELGFTSYGRIRFPNGSTPYTLTTGSLTTANDKNQSDTNLQAIEVVPGNTNDVDHRLIINGDLTLNFFDSENVGTDNVNIDLYNSEAENNVILEFTGEGDHAFDNNFSSGQYNIELYRLILNKGTAQSNTLSINTDMTISGLNSTTEKSIELQNGTLILNDVANDFELNTGGGDFTIPTSAGLNVQAGTVRVSAAGVGAGNGMRLDGKLTISGGNVILDGGAAADNYIEYGSAGGSEIEVTAGNLVVGSQLRRNILSDDGVINYSQSGGTALFGANSAPENSRGVFEIINTGSAGSSSFNLSGASTVFALVHAQSSPLTGSFIIDSDVSANVTTDPFIDFGFNGTVASTTYQNDLNETYEINSAVALPNIRVNNSNFNDPIVDMVVQPLTVTTNLEIATGGTLRSNNFDLTINSGFTNNGIYTPGTNTTIFNGATQLIGGSTNTTFNNLNVNPSTSLTLNNPITVNGNLNILSGELNDNGNRITLVGNLHATTNHLSDGSGTGGILMQGGGAQEINLPDGEVSLAKLLIDNANGVAINENAGVAVVLTIDDELALENGVLALGDNRIIFDSDATATTSSSFSADRMISVNGVKKSDGVQRNFTGADVAEFEIPVGTPDKYTPVFIDVNNAAGTGNILIKPINGIHPSATGPDALDYYWVVSSSAVASFDGDIRFRYVGTDADDADQFPATWTGVRLIAPNWSKPPGAVLDEVTNTITFDETDLSNGGADPTTFDGEFTAGNDIPNQLAAYRSNKASADWGTAADWDIETSGDGLFDDGNGVPQPGTVVEVRSSDVVIMDTGDNDQNIFSLQIDGTLDVADSDGHNFGDVSGTGILRISNSTLPGGNYDNFFTTSAGQLELSGSGSYTISPDFATGVRGLIISGSGGTKTLPSTTVNIGSEGLTVSGGATLDNLTNNNDIVVAGNVTVNTTGAFNLGNSSGSLSAQDFTLTAGTFNTTGASLDLAGGLSLAGGTFNAGSATHTIGGDFDFNTASTFNRGSGRITFDGSTDQNITSNSATIDFHNLRVNKSGGSLVVGSNTVTNVNNRLGLLNGSVINTENTGVQLRLVGLATYAAGTDGYISGPLFKDLDDESTPFTFRIGKGSTYKPLIINPQDGSYVGDITWEAEYYTGTADDFVSGENDILSMSAIETNADPDQQVINVNASEYWRIDSGGGSASLESITLDISDLDITTDDINDQLLQVMVWDEAGGEWDHLGGVSSGTPTAANVATQSALSFSEKIITSGIENNTLLPVELLYFAGESVENVASLEWATATELNNDYFEILRSSDGVDFNVIGRVEGNGTTNEEITYLFKDSRPLSGLSYYQLKQVDFDGSENFHNIIQVQNDFYQSQVNVVIYPNPATSDNIGLRISSGDDHTPYEVSIVDLTGRKYYAETIKGSFTLDQKIEPNSRMIPGVYILNVKQGNTEIKSRLIIRN